jgi:hypothetical protein
LPREMPRNRLLCINDLARRQRPAIAIGRCIDQHEQTFATRLRSMIPAILRTHVKRRLTRKAPRLEDVIKFAAIIPIEKDIVMGKCMATDRR